MFQNWWWYQFAHNNPVWKIEIEGLEGVPANDAIEIQAEAGNQNSILDVKTESSYGRSSGTFSDGEFYGIFQPATGEEYDQHPVAAVIKDISYLGLSLMGIDAIDNAIAAINDENVSTSGKVEAVAGALTTTKAGSKTKTGNAQVHGNSKASTKAQTVYGLKNQKTSGIEKVGISSGKVDKTGVPYRANKQVNALNKKGGNYKAEVLEQVPVSNEARVRALELEKSHTNANKKNLNPLIHKRPKAD